MARPIKETPTLRGKDAENFINEMENSKKASSKVNVRIRENFNMMKSISKF